MVGDQNAEQIQILSLSPYSARYRERFCTSSFGL